MGNLNHDDMEWTQTSLIVNSFTPLYFNQLYYLETSVSNALPQPGKVQIPHPPPPREKDDG